MTVVYCNNFQELIELGAQTLIVPGNLPIGCSAAYLTVFASDNKNDYDATTGCLNWLNEFSQYHNQLLQEELDRLRQLYPDVTLIYADYYNAAMRIYRAPSKFGTSQLPCKFYTWNLIFWSETLEFQPL